MNKVTYTLCKVKDKLLYGTAGLVSGFLMSIRSEGCADLWTTSADESLLDDVIHLYQKWWWVAGLVTLIAWLVLKEDNKLKPIMKKVLIGLVIAFIATYAFDLIKNSIIHVAEHFQ